MPWFVAHATVMVPGVGGENCQVHAAPLPRRFVAGTPLSSRLAAAVFVTASLKVIATDVSAGTTAPAAG